MQCLSKLCLKPAQKPVMLIDTSYYVFYKYFAVYNWCKKQNANITAETIMQDDVFVQKYNKMFEKTLVDLCKDNKIKEYSNVVFVKDCPRDKIWRHNHIDGYKDNREDSKRSFNRNVFTHTYQNLIPGLEQKYGVQVFGHEHLEADDVVAIVSTKIMEVFSNIELVIITNDNDYIQLHNHTNNNHLKIANLQGKNICERVGCNPEIYIQMKKILGDKSDNIPSIMKKCGEKTALKYATNNTLLQQLFQSNQSVRDRYNLNEQMVDFMFIPTDLRSAVIDRLELI
jgi:5'-3' exonuclease